MTVFSERQYKNSRGIQNSISDMNVPTKSNSVAGTGLWVKSSNVLFRYIPAQLLVGLHVTKKPYSVYPKYSVFADSPPL